jgi:hypothetical protein
MADHDWVDDFVVGRLAEHYQRVRLREAKKAAKNYIASAMSSDQTAAR